MWTWNKLTAAICLVALTSACGGKERVPGGTTPLPSIGNLARCAKYGFSPNISNGSADPDCKPDQCGLNGTWLGRGIRFRTLHIALHKPNSEGIAITRFRLGSTDLRLDVQAHDLIGIPVQNPNPQLKRNALHNAELTLTDNDSNEYTLKIDSVDPKDFWTDCKSGNPDCPTVTQKQQVQIPVYNFSVTGPGGCPVELCDPALGDDPGASHHTIPNGTGRAVIFRGDFYDDNYTVRDVAAKGEEDVFNIACKGTTISKLAFLRHTTAAETSYNAVVPKLLDQAKAAMQTSLHERQTMMRLLTADYCGTGHPYGQNGTPIHIGLHGPYAVTAADYVTNAGDVTDGVWTSQGARCIGVPRIAPDDPESMRNKIQQDCDTASRPVPENCETWHDPFPGTYHAISTNPAGQGF
jgi:hypothetical protein